MANSLEGVAELTAKLSQLGAELAAKNLRSSVRAAMKIAYAKAEATIPVWQPKPTDLPYHRTYKKRIVFPGFSKRSLRLLSTLDKKTGVARAVLGVRKEAFYAVQFVERGSIHNMAKPWLVPALESSNEEIQRALAVEIKKRIERIAKRRAKR